MAAVHLDAAAIPHVLISGGLLSPSEIVAGGWSVSERYSRNRNFVVHNGARSGFFVKSTNDANHVSALVREFNICRSAAASSALEEIIPRAVWCGDGVAVYDLVDGESAYAYLRNTRFNDERFPALLGAAMADAHCHLGRALRFARPAIELVPFTPVALTPLQIARNTSTELSEAQTYVSEEIARRRELLANIDELRTNFETNSVLHGDVKLSNVVVTSDVRCVLVDWETCGVGDAAWDVAGIVQSYLMLWTTSLGEDAAAGEPTDLSAIRRHINIMWRAYVARASLSAQVEGAVRARVFHYAGARMLQTVFEMSRLEKALVRQRLLQIDVAEQLVAHGEAFFSC